MPAVIGEDPVAAALGFSANGVRKVAHLVSNPGSVDTAGEGGVGGIDQFLVHRIRGAHNETDCRVPAPALHEGPAIDAQQIAILQHIPVRDAVHHGVVDARADDP
ncbi:hypothetical protein AHiyo1_10150 [Arthrobacter sp. Hiyo1]|nr:hypothetical protein AHiyo1_10150 [Arthrobacter sp. Hiyo1]